MGKLHVLVDSTAHIRQQVLDNCPELHVVPLAVMVGEQVWPEPELSNAELFRLVTASGKHPRTSQPSPGDFLNALQPLIDQGCECIILTISGGLSGTVRSAGTARHMLASGGLVHIIDSGTTAIGMEKMAQTAFELARQGLTAPDIAACLQKIAAATYTMFVPDTLEYLHKGGRIGGAAALFGTILQIRPILYLTEGKVSVLDKVRTRSRALARMTDELQMYGRLAYIGVVHIEAEPEAVHLAEKLREQYPAVPVTVTPAGSVLGAHLGPGIVGVVFQKALD